MATALVLYRAEGTDDQLAQAPRELQQDPIQAAALPLPQTTNPPTQGATDVPPELPTEEELYSEIEELHVATLIIDQAFHDITRKLSDVVNDSKQSTGTDLYDTCRTLGTQWEEHHQTYRRLLWRSRTFAGEAQGAIDDFRELVLPSLMARDRSAPEKIQIIQRELRMIQELSQPSQNLSQDFLDFSRSLDTFIAGFSRIVENFGIDTQSQKVDELESNLRAAKAAMETASEEVKRVGWKCVAAIAVCGVSLLLALFAPVGWVQVAGAVASVVSGVAAVSYGVQYFGARKRRRLATEEYEAIKAVYELEKASLSQMRKLESALDGAKPLVQDVTMKLGIFANVWAAITADLGRLRSALHHTSDPTSPLFIDRVRRLERMYGRLSQALRQYQTRVTLPVT